jgi:hypothetical protein
VSPAQGGAYGDWEVVLEANQRYEAELAALKLRGEGLEARIIDKSYRQEPVPFVRALSRVLVLVPSESAEAARALLARGGELPADAESEEP